jgi:hypothetical protein
MTRYRLQLDLSKAAENAPANLRAQVQQAIQALGRSGLIPAQVWVDRAGRLRRFSFSATATVGSSSRRIVESYDFFGFGTQVHVTAPPGGEVLDFTPFLTQLGSSLGSGTVTSSS